MNKHKLCNIVKAADTKDLGVIRFRLTERMVDRDSEVIEPKGILMDDYKSNPVFLWGHDVWGDHLPLGKTLMDSVEQTDQYLDADVKFDLGDDFAKLVYNKYKKGFLTSGSIRFVPVAVDSTPVLPGQKGVTVTKSNLLEFSGVILPANTGAVVLAKALEEFKDKVPDDYFKSLIDFSQARNYEHSTDGWIDYMNKKNGDLDLAPEKIYIFGGVEITPDIIDGLKAGKYMRVSPNEEITLSDPPDEVVANEWLETKDLTEWPQVAQAMNDLIDSDISLNIKKLIYDILIKSYETFGKEPVEFTAIKKSVVQETGDFDEDDFSEDDILDEILNNFNTNKE